MPKIKVEDMDHYEILNVSRKATYEEIEKAYFLGKTAYAKDSLAHYTLLKEEERQQMLDRIEAAFRILGDEEKRRAYDENSLDKRDRYQERAKFRKSTERMFFEDLDTRNNQGHFFKRLFSSGKKD